MTNIQEALQTAKPVLLVFYSPECQRCVEMQPVIEELKKEEGDKAVVIAIDGPANPDLVKQFHVDTYPSYKLFKDSQEVWRDGGRKPLSELKDMIARFI